MHDYKTKIIMGDFNADQFSASADARFVRRFIEDNNLRSIPYGVTHRTATSETWLDLCLVDEQDDVTDYWKSESPFASDHHLITVQLNVKVCVPKQQTFTYRDFKVIDSEALNFYLDGCDWSVFDGDDFNLESGISYL